MLPDYAAFFSENMNNLIQLFVLVCTGMALLILERALVHKTAVYLLCGGFFCVVLGDFYYVICGLLHGPIPSFCLADLSFVGFYCFLIASLKSLKLPRVKTPWYAFIFAGFAAACFVGLIILFGNIVTNLIWCIPFVVLAFLTGVGFRQTKAGSKREQFLPLYFSILIFLCGNLVMFFSTGFLYILIDASMTLFLPSIAFTLYLGEAKESGVRKKMK